MKEYITDKGNIIYITCNNPTEAEPIRTVRNILMHIYMQLLKATDLKDRTGQNAMLISVLCSSNSS